MTRWWKSWWKNQQTCQDYTTEASGKASGIEQQLQQTANDNCKPDPESAMQTWNAAITDRKQRFLVVEDEPDIADLVALHLSDLNADVTTEQDGAKGLTKAMDEHWDAVLLDLRLPTMDGLDICRQLRAKSSYVPIMMLTSRSTELDRVLGLEIGADDYMVKPFSVAELKARVKALVRRNRQNEMQETAEPEQLRCGDLQLDRMRRKALLRGKCLELTAREFDLLWFFAKRPGQVFKRSELLDQVWGYGHDGYEHTVNSHINRLRSKIEADPGNPVYIETVWGVGYRFSDSKE